MSLGTFARVWATSPASGNTLLVHLALADLAQAQLVQIPQADIAELARCSVTTTARALQELVELGVIEVVDDRCKPTIYCLNHQTDGISTQPRTNRVDNRQNDGILQPDGIEPHESGQIEGKRVQDASETASETGSPRGTVPDPEPFRAQTSNIGKPIPIITGPAEVAVVALRDLQDEAKERVVVEDPAPPINLRGLAATLLHPTAPNPAQELAAFLRVIGVKQNPEAPLYWFRDEHVRDFEGLLRLADKSGEILINEVRAAGIKMPDIRRLSDTHDRLAAAKIIPF